MSKKTTAIETQITLPLGYLATGIHAGIKRAPKKDLALLHSQVPATAAGVFTTNQVKAAPVWLCIERLASSKKGQSIVVNSGNANACNGDQGTKDAYRMGRLAAELLHVNEQHVFVCSTGHIGRPLPMREIEAGIAQAAPSLSPEGGPSAAEAIMTTDTRPKFGTVSLAVEGKPITVTALTKGAGMIEPNMATMLAFFPLGCGHRATGSSTMPQPSRQPKLQQDNGGWRHKAQTIPYSS